MSWVLKITDSMSPQKHIFTLKHTFQTGGLVILRTQTTH